MTSKAMAGHALNDAPTGATAADGVRAVAAHNDPAHVARLYLALTSLFVVCATVAAVLIRLELLTPPLDLLNAWTFGALLSLHGTLMMYFVALPAFPGVLGNALLPRVLGIRTVAMPRLMHASWWVLAAGGLLVLYGFISGGTDAGWMFDMQFGGRFTSPGIVPVALGVGLAAASLVLMGMTFVVTVVQWRRFQAGPRHLPPLAAALLFAGASALLAGPVLGSCMLLVLADRLGDLSVFAPTAGGDPELFAALFRFFLSPAQSIVLLLAFGTVITIVARHAQVRTRGAYGADPVTTLALGVLALAGLLAWGGPVASPWIGYAAQHVYVLFYGVAATAAGVVILRTLAPLRHGCEKVDPPLVYAAAFLFTVLLLFSPGLLLAVPATRTFLGSTSFATGQLHMMMGAALGMAFLGGLHEAWPRLAGRQYREGVGHAAAIATIVGTYLTFTPMFWLGIAGASTFRANAYLPEFQIPQVLSTAGMTILLAGVALAGVNLATGPRVTAPPQQ